MAHLSADQLADFLLSEARQRGEALRHQKLQKLCYYAQAWWLALYEEPLIDEDFQAWVPGPVLISQKERFGAFRCKPISRDLQFPEVPAPVRSHLEEIFDVFGEDDEADLERMVHREAPWVEARGDLALHEVCTNSICKEAMRTYYATLK